MPTEIKKKNIVFVLPTLNAGGAERVLITLMNNIDRDRYIPHFIVVSGEGSMRSLIRNDVQVHDLKSPIFYFSIFKLYRVLRSIGPEIVCSTMVQTNTLVLLLKIFFKKTVFVVREANMPSALSSRDYGFKGVLCKASYKYLYPFADMVISPSQKIIEEFRDIIKIDVSRHERLFNPIDAERIHANLARKAALDIGAISSKLCFLSVGRLKYEKGFDLLIPALAGFQPNCDWVLDIYGEGSEHDALDALIKDCGLEKNVFLRGFTENPWYHMALADAVIMPSRWEGLPNVAIESVFCGTKVIATQYCGGIQEIADEVAAGNIIICDHVEDVVGEMLKVSPSNKAEAQNSFLSDRFKLESIIFEFEVLLDKVSADIKP